MVDRGFVSRDALERARQVAAGVRPDVEKLGTLVAEAAKQGTVRVEGMIAAPAKRNNFTPDNKPEAGEWYWTDTEARAKVAAGETGDVQPVLVDELFSGCPFPSDSQTLFLTHRLF